jgi:hypothetical protein
MFGKLDGGIRLLGEGQQGALTEKDWSYLTVIVTALEWLSDPDVPVTIKVT